MNLVKVKCVFCGKEYFREVGRVNEAKKFGWNQYCSKECQNKTKTTRVEMVCGNPNCDKLVSRILHEFKNSKSGLVFCSHSCAAIMNNKKFPKRKAKMRVCVKCRKQFLRRKGYFKYCSTECKNKARPKLTPHKLIDIIKTKTQELGRVPARRELRNINDSCRKLFGSWNNAVLAAGFTPNRSHDNRMYKRSNAKALDSHLCDSVSELLIDNWLYQNNIPHERDARYPGTHHKADWQIISKNQKIFVEYFGLANDSPRYDRAVKEKKEICHKHKIKLIEIYHWDLYPKRQFEKKIRNELENLNNVSISQGGETCTLDFRFPKAVS